jgi:hypothetical protein
MIAARRLAVGTVGVVLVTMGTARAQSVTRYRDYQIGGNLAAVVALAGLKISDATTIHQRPAVLQNLDWRAPFSLVRAGTPKDPVERIVFSFYNDQLFRLVIDYDRQRTKGLTDGDMVEAISVLYGLPSPPPLKARDTLSQPAVELGTRVASWGDDTSSAVLYRSSYASGFQLVVTSSALETLARQADLQAILLDEREAPQRDLARQKQEAADAQATQDKARLTNKAGFRP